jgi:hypothetical protein
MPSMGGGGESNGAGVCHRPLHHVPRSPLPRFAGEEPNVSAASDLHTNP